MPEPGDLAPHLAILPFVGVPAYRRAGAAGKYQMVPGWGGPAPPGTLPSRRPGRRLAPVVTCRGASHGRASAAGGRIRLYHRGRGLRRLRAGEPPVGRCGRPRAPARSWRPRQLDLVPHPGRLPVRHRQSARGLDVQDRAGGGAQRPQPQLSARQGDRRLFRHQRHDLHARPGGRLRPLAPARARRLGLRRRAAVLQAARAPFSGAERSSRGRRRIADRGAARALGHPRCLLRGRRAGRHQAHPGFQHRRQRRLVRVPRQSAARAALVGGARLSQAGAQSAEPAARDRLPGGRAGARRPPRRRRALAPGRRDQNRRVAGAR